MGDERFEKNAIDGATSRSSGAIAQSSYDASATLSDLTPFAGQRLV